LKDLERAYASTIYRMYLGSRALDFSVDTRCLKDSRIVLWRRMPRWVFITAYNPKSVMLSNRENLVLDKKLRNFLIGKKFKFVRGDAIPRSSDWTIEKGFFVFNISKAIAKKICQRFNQNAILYSGTRDRPHIIWNEAT